MGCDWVCSRSAADRRKFGCQTQAMDKLAPRDVPICSKSEAFRERIDCGSKTTWMADFGIDGKRLAERGKELLSSKYGPVTWDSKRTERIGAMNNLEARRYGARFGARGARDAALMDDDDNTQLRAALADLGILEDDVEKIIARLSSPGGVDTAPSGMGAGGSNIQSEVHSFSNTSDPDAGGGSTRVYAPTDSDPAMGATDRRGRRMAGDAANHVAAVMARRQAQYNAGQITFDQLRKPIAPPEPVQTAASERWHRENFPHQDRLANGGKSFDERFGTGRIKQAT